MPQRRIEGGVQGEGQGQEPPCVPCWPPVLQPLRARMTHCPHMAPVPAVASLCRLVKEHAAKLGRPKAGVLPLREAVGKLCPSPDFLCPIHADFFQL